LYIVATGISSWLWAAAFTYLGYSAGGVALRALGFASRLDVRLGLLALLLLAVLIVITRRRRIAERTAHVLSGERISMMTTAERRAAVAQSRVR
jgi:membrane protein DedA with SNARE-associated domain